ncbi:MAG TPA: quinoprotein dehydrogenase-associated SoxYZ-like carrier [Gammaproteobacteria bacterium]|nr:quinoprotein dehydrogenase-associated SoxYZ-like carrier [Gammaproteobacteria bacterium]
MFNRMAVKMAMVLSLALAGVCARAEQSPISVWDAFLKDKYFKDMNIVEDKTVIDMTTPYRAEDASLTPVSIIAKIPQTAERYIKDIYLIVDQNPEPLVGVFHTTVDMGKADLSMRIRIDKYTNVRAIAVLNNGEHHMVTNYVKASGGCSDPFGGDIYEALKTAGRMKFRTVGDVLADQTEVGQLNISHPNFTGMSVNQRTGNIVPPHYIDKLKLTYNDKVVMTAETGISISADPSYRFFFKPGQGGRLKAEVEDSKGGKYVEEFDIQPQAAEAVSTTQKS